MDAEPVQALLVPRLLNAVTGMQELAEQQKRILMKEDNLYIQQLAPKAYISPLFTREQLAAAQASGQVPS